jgi:hypothetical protein
MNPDTLELVLRQSNGAILIPLKRAATILGREPQTIRNQLSLGKCPLIPVRMGRSVFFRADDLAREIDQARTQQHNRRGRPTKAEKVREQRNLELRR